LVAHLPERWARLVARPTALALALAGTLIGLGLVKYGIQMWPGWRFLHEIAVNWRHPTQGPLITAPADYLVANATGSFATGILGLTATPVYVACMAGLAIAAIATPFLMPRARRSSDMSRLLFVMLAGGPVLALLLLTIGGYDAISVLGLGIAVLARSHWVAAAGWAVVGFQHSSLGVLAAVMLAVFWVASEGLSVRARLVPVAVGVLVGASANALVMLQLGGVTSRLELYLHYPLQHYVDVLIAGMPLLLFSALGMGWALLLDPGARRLRATRVLLALAVVTSFLVPLIAEDQSRMVAMVLYLCVLAWTITVVESRDGSSMTGRLWSRYAVAAAIVPVVMLYAGHMVPAGWNAFLAFRSTLG